MLEIVPKQFFFKFGTRGKQVIRRLLLRWKTVKFD